MLWLQVNERVARSNRKLSESERHHRPRGVRGGGDGPPAALGEMASVFRDRIRRLYGNSVPGQQYFSASLSDGLRSDLGVLGLLSGPEPAAGKPKPIDQRGGRAGGVVGGRTMYPRCPKWSGRHLGLCLRHRRRRHPLPHSRQRSRPHLAGAVRVWGYVQAPKGERLIDDGSLDRIRRSCPHRGVSPFSALVRPVVERLKLWAPKSSASAGRRSLCER